VTLDIQPGSGCHLEHYSVWAGNECIELPFLSGETAEDAGWWRTLAGVREFHPVPAPAGLEDTAPWRMGYLDQMADFLRGAETPAGNACCLDEAAQILELRDAIFA